jgi:hypothetical protein
MGIFHGHVEGEIVWLVHCIAMVPRLSIGPLPRWSRTTHRRCAMSVATAYHWHESSTTSLFAMPCVVRSTYLQIRVGCGQRTTSSLETVNMELQKCSFSQTRDVISLTGRGLPHLETDAAASGMARWDKYPMIIQYVGTF